METKKNKNEELNNQLKSADSRLSEMELTDDMLDQVNGGVRISKYEDEFKKEVTTMDWVTNL